MKIVKASEFFADVDTDLDAEEATVNRSRRRSSAHEFTELKIRVAMCARGISREKAVALIESLARKKAERDDDDA